MLDGFLENDIRAALTKVNARDAQILRLYFGLEGNRAHTLQEIATTLRTSGERVRQLKELCDGWAPYPARITGRLGLVQPGQKTC